jgi:hypothetical protein
MLFGYRLGLVVLRDPIIHLLAFKQFLFMVVKHSALLHIRTHSKEDSWGVVLDNVINATSIRDDRT